LRWGELAEGEEPGSNLLHCCRFAPLNAVTIEREGRRGVFRDAGPRECRRTVSLRSVVPETEHHCQRIIFGIQSDSSGKSVITASVASRGG
jgi:hypothetical protein